MAKARPEVPVAGRQMTAARAKARVVCDVGNHHALELSRAGLHVKFVPVPEAGPVALHDELTPVFDQRYREHLKGFPVERAARFFIGVAQDRGGTPEALDALASLVPMTAQERKTAMDQHHVSTASHKAGGKKSGAKAKGHNGKAHGNGKKTAPAPAGPTAAGRFRELIMKGGKTDDQIFQTVQKEFKLPDSKRSYVAWYRNDLKKKGERPPAPKEAKE